MIIVEAFRGKAITEHPVEIVERKGVGHPDYICDAVMESISIALSGAYLEEFGAILHHNIDKGLLAAGMAEIRFGGGRLLKPMELIIGDRATYRFAGRSVPVDDIAVAAAGKWISEHLRFVKPEKDLNCRLVLAPGSVELTDIFRRPGSVRVANDTSAAVGYYPLSPTETVVLEMEQYLNAPRFKERYPETGEDVKVMGLRMGKSLDLTIAMPLLARYVSSENEYFTRKEAILRDIREFLDPRIDFDRKTVHFNTLDEPGRGLGGIYLSLLGTSAEDADSGQVGRGNRVNGLISLNRPMGTEAAAGKNPVSHVGKIYNVLSHQLARRIFDEIEGLKEVYVFLLSRIGMPIDQPVLAAAQVLPEEGRGIEEINRPIQDIFMHAFAEMDDFCRRLAMGEYPVC